MLACHWALLSAWWSLTKTLTPDTLPAHTSLSKALSLSNCSLQVSLLFLFCWEHIWQLTPSAEAGTCSCLGLGQFVVPLQLLDPPRYAVHVCYLVVSVAVQQKH